MFLKAAPALPHWERNPLPLAAVKINCPTTPQPPSSSAAVKIIDLEGLSMRDVGSSAFKWCDSARAGWRGSRGAGAETCSWADARSWADACSWAETCS